MGGIAFTNSSKPQPVPLEERIVDELWKWQSLPKCDRAEVTQNQTGLAGMLEFYLCGVFRCKNSAPSSGWWCDGTFELSITQAADTSFLIVGAACWAKADHESTPFYLAPFEIEFDFSELNSKVPKRVVVRFGCLDRDGQIKRIPFSGNPWIVIKSRPTLDREWAFAVELT